MDFKSLRDGLLTNWISDIVVIGAGAVTTIAKAKKWKLNAFAYGLIVSAGAAGAIGAWSIMVTHLSGVSVIWVEFFGIFVFSASLIYFGARGIAKARPVADGDTPNPESFELAQQSNPPNIEIKVLDAHIGKPPNEEDSYFGGTSQWLLFHLRIWTNVTHGLGVTGWKVKYGEQFDTFWSDASVIPIPPGLNFQSLGQYGSLDSAATSVFPPIAADKSLIPLGDFREGYLLCTVMPNYVHECFRFVFTVEASDARNGTSEVLVSPGNWLRPTEFSIPVSVSPLRRSAVFSVNPPLPPPAE